MRLDRLSAPLMIAAVAYLLSRTRRGSSSSSGGRVRSNVSAGDRAQIVELIAERGWPPHEVDAAIMLESGWRTDARNPLTDASGLIQLMPAWFARKPFREDLATGRERAAAFRLLPALEQLPWIQEYFAEVGNAWRVPGDTYMALAAPAYIGSPDEKVIWSIGSKAWQQNPPWRSANNGPITAGSIRAVLLKRLHHASV